MWATPRDKRTVGSDRRRVSPVLWMKNHATSGLESRFTKLWADPAPPRRSLRDPTLPHQRLTGGLAAPLSP